MNTNPILATDSYKFSHFLQYPPEARRLSAYVESRRNALMEGALFFGLQAFVVDKLARPITAADIDEAEAIATAHGEPFNRAGFEVIVADHGGYLPIEIVALPEGTLVPTRVPMLQVVNTDPRLPWLVSFVETALLRAIWYPTTVATVSATVKRVIAAGLDRSSDDPAGQLPFKLHDFGARGASSAESAALGGLAHLVNFMGTDTVEALVAARRWYDEPMAGFSIPAAEHSTMTAWGRPREADAYANMIRTFKGDGKLVAVVSDSYDLFHAVGDIWGGELKDLVTSVGGTLVVRPDSGDPVETPLKALDILWQRFGGSVNAKGYRVLSPHVRLIQGDGMNPVSIEVLVTSMIERGFSVDNIAFGMGAGLLQKVDRDTLSFAMKTNAMEDADGRWHDISKSPATDPSKGSKEGRQAVIRDGGRLVGVKLDELGSAENEMRPVWRDGEWLVRESFATIRARAAEGVLGR